MFSDFARDVATRGDGRRFKVPGRLEFTISGQDASLVSGLRRAIMTDVLTAAFRFDAVDHSKQDVRVTANTGSLHNEFIGERIGLLPLHLSKSELVDFKPASWRFELSAENKGAKPLDVTTADIEAVPLDEASHAPAFFKPDILTGKHPLITVLMPGQKLSLEATASFGNGHEHARFNPVAACAMHPVQDEDAVAKERAARDDKATFDALDAKRIVRKDVFRFSLESQCGMTPREIVEAGYEALAGRLRSLAKATEGTERVSEVPEQTGSSDDIRGLKLSGEDHTSGALIQARLLHVTDFAGYYVPHLLDRSIVVRMRVPSGSTARGMLQEACESAADLCETALSEWQKASRN
jgi:DNA-directed RNA polymerase subunit L